MRLDGMIGMFRALVLLLSLLLPPSAVAAAEAKAPAAGSLWTEPVTGIVFVWVPGGQFAMGCDSAEGPCMEGSPPPQTRAVPGFWMSRTEVSRAQWAKLIATDPSVAAKPGDYPVDQVHWQDAQAFLEGLNKTGHGHFRLPSEAEWEYACRGGKAGESYCGGNAPDDLAWYMKNSKRSSQPVGTKAANGFGLLDMSGNLWEWTEDCWSETLPAGDGARPYHDQSCESRVLKGGSWGAYPAQLRVTARRADADVKCPYIGLRLVRDPG